MTPQEVIDWAGGTQQKAADRIGITRNAIARWVMAGKVPPLRQAAIEVLTGGELRADMPRKEVS